MKRFFNNLDTDSKIVLTCLAVTVFVALVVIPAHGHYQMIEIFGECGCPICR